MHLMQHLRESLANKAMGNSTPATLEQPSLVSLSEQQRMDIDTPTDGEASGLGNNNLATSGFEVLAVHRYKLGVSVGFGGIIMIFAAFTSAMVVRSGLSDDWKSFGLPSVLWFSTVALLVSSFTVEKAKRALRNSNEKGLKTWLAVTTVLGVSFLVSQWMGWLNLTERGLYLAANPSHSFFYVFTVGHGLHLLGGLLAIGYVTGRTWCGHHWVTRSAAIEAAALYWHFMDALWLYLFVLLLVWR